MTILFFGDIVGRAGRRAMAEVLPVYKKKYKPDLVMANGENLAHGVGITMNTAEEMFAAGIDILTGGNHIFKKQDYKQVFTDYSDRVIRPANYPEGVAGQGFTTRKIGDRRVVVINLNGRVFFNEDFDDPFRKFDEVLAKLKAGKDDIVIVDFHTEATSEVNAFGWYADSRATAVIGTHTHVPTADAKVLTKGTAFVSDAGMVGLKDSIIGVEKEGPLEMFLTQLPVQFERPESGLVQVNAMLLEVGKNGKVKEWKRVDEEVEI